MSKVEEIEGWVARDKNNALWVYLDEEPKVDEKGYYDNACGRKMLIPYYLLPNIQFSNSPKKIKITIEDEL